MVELDREQNVRLARGYQCLDCGVILEGREAYDDHFDRVHVDGGEDDQDDDQTKLEIEPEPEEPEPDEEE